MGTRANFKAFGVKTIINDCSPHRIVAHEIIAGRSEKEKDELGLDGSIFLGKHYVKMGNTTSLSNEIYMDMNRSHVVFVCGKRGSGKSYTLGVMAEGMADMPEEVRQNLSIILLDTMGVYWSMKYPNKEDRNLLEEWGMKPKGMDVEIYSPKGYYEQARKEGIPVDESFSLRVAELDSHDWQMTFDVDDTSEVGVLIDRVVEELDGDYSIQDIIDRIKENDDAGEVAKKAAINRFKTAQGWGVFDAEGTPMTDLARGGQVTVLDVSAYATMPGSWNIKSAVIGLISEKLFIQRMKARKEEEFESVSRQVQYYEEEQENKFPLVWLVIDEAHEFLPSEGSTLATEPLVTILREGRQPGISLVLASQQPGKIHTDVLTQSDIVISHRITAKIDIDALGTLMQSYMRAGLDEIIDNLPREKGAAIILDDNNEKMYPMKVRPRMTWHGGSAPNALKEKDELF